MQTKLGAIQNFRAQLSTALGRENTRYDAWKGSGTLFGMRARDCDGGVCQTESVKTRESRSLGVSAGHRLLYRSPREGRGKPKHMGSAGGLLSLDRDLNRVGVWRLIQRSYWKMK